LDVASATVRKLVVDLERQIGVRLFQRAPRGIVYPTELGENLAIGLKRALWEIRAGIDELKSLDGRVEGRVHVGALSTARSVVLPNAINELHRVHPGVLVHIYWASYDDLQVALNCGDVDFIVGSLRDEELRFLENSAHNLMADRIEVVVRAEHPLRGAEDVSLEELLTLDWVLPPPHSPLRAWFRGLLESQGLAEPKPFIQTASLAILRGVLLGSDCVALSTRLQCWHDLVDHGPLAVLPVSAFYRARAERPFYLHLTRRANVLLSPASEALWKSVSLVASQLETAIGGQWADRQYAKLSVHSP
jgi:LysR family transcriptional regulator of gallate degradation